MASIATTQLELPESSGNVDLSFITFKKATSSQKLHPKSRSSRGFAFFEPPSNMPLPGLYIKNIGVLEIPSLDKDAQAVF